MKAAARASAVVAGVVAVGLGAGAAVGALQAPTERVSVSSSGAQGNRASGDMWGTYQLSPNGRFVVFDSVATNLVRRDTNGLRDVFVRDRETGRTERVSLSSAGRQGNGRSVALDVSANGRYVLFESQASNLVRTDTNRSTDLFVHDRRIDKTTRVSVGRRGQATNWSQGGSMSHDGRFVVFESAASNLVRGDTNRTADVFVRDRRRQTTRRVSVSTTGAQASGESHVFLSESVSANGRYIAFSSKAANLVRGDTNRVADVFVRDRVAKTTTRASVRPNGKQFSLESVSPAISADGNYVAFQMGFFTEAGIAYDIFVRDRAAGMTELVTADQPPPDATLWNNHSPSISAHGRYVTFMSNAPLPGEDPTDESLDGFVRDTHTGVTQVVTLTSTGERVGGDAWAPVISADGQWVAFSTDTSSVVGDTNRRVDVFVRHR